MTGPALLREYLDANDIGRPEAATELGVAASTLHYWLNGSKPRTAKKRKRIAAWSKGQVPESAWDEEGDC